MHTDLNRLRKGMVGAQFWSVYVSADLSEPQAVQATSQEASAVSPSALFLQAIQRRWLIGSSEKRPFGQTSTQSLQAEHLSASTTGRPWASRCKASKWQTASQSPKPRQPQAHSLPPPPTTAAARQVLRPA